MGGDETMDGSFDAEARIARIAERVDNQGIRITHLEAVVQKGFSDIQTQFGRQFADLSNELRAKDRTPWGVIWSAMGVCFAVLVGIGGALYYPVREAMVELRVELKEQRREFVLQTNKVQEDRVIDLQRQLDRLLDKK